MQDFFLDHRPAVGKEDNIAGTMEATGLESSPMELIDVETSSISMPTPEVQLLNPGLLFKYPFLSGENVELCAKGLSLCDYQSQITNEEHITVQLEKLNANGRAHIVTFSQVDRYMLDPATYVNDNIIDFWIAWVTRHSLGNATHVQSFTSHFYTKLIEEGVEHVSSWIQKRKLNIFANKLMLIPICLELHWSLCVIVNANNMQLAFDDRQTNVDDEIPFMMLLDSIGMHDEKIIQKNVWDWINVEWRKKSIVTKEAVLPIVMVKPKGKVYCPPVFLFDYLAMFVLKYFCGY